MRISALLLLFVSLVAGGCSQSHQVPLTGQLPFASAQNPLGTRIGVYISPETAGQQFTLVEEISGCQDNVIMPLGAALANNAPLALHSRFAQVARVNAPTPAPADLDYVLALSIQASSYQFEWTGLTAHRSTTITLGGILYDRGGQAVANLTTTGASYCERWACFRGTRTEHTDADDELRAASEYSGLGDHRGLWKMAVNIALHDALQQMASRVAEQAGGGSSR